MGSHRVGPASRRLPVETERRAKLVPGWRIGSLTEITAQKQRQVPALVSRFADLFHSNESLPEHVPNPCFVKRDFWRRLDPQVEIAPSRAPLVWPDLFFRRATFCTFARAQRARDIVSEGLLQGTAESCRGRGRTGSTDGPTQSRQQRSPASCLSLLRRHVRWPAGTRGRAGSTWTRTLLWRLGRPSPGRERRPAASTMFEEAASRQARRTELRASSCGRVDEN